MKKQKSMNAIGVERLFIIAVLLLSILLVVNFIFVARLLTSQSKKADHAKIESEVSVHDIETIESAGKKIAKDLDAVRRAEAIVAESQLYQYQDQIINDLQGYAGKSGLEIAGYSFSTAPTTAPGAAAPATPAPGTAGAAAQTAPIVGVASTSVTITLGENVGYTNFLNLLRYIENNVTRMQVTDIALAPDPKNRTVLLNPTLSITVYTS